MIEPANGDGDDSTGDDRDGLIADAAARAADRLGAEVELGECIWSDAAGHATFARQDGADAVIVSVHPGGVIEQRLSGVNLDDLR